MYPMRPRTATARTTTSVNGKILAEAVREAFRKQKEVIANLLLC